MIVDLRRGNVASVIQGGYALLTRLIQLSSSTVPANAILIEDGSSRLLEDGTNLLLG